MREVQPGDEFAGYRIEGLAGRGGMGLVYRAVQARLERVVAIKVVAPELAADPEFRTRFEREAVMAAEIEHPNVIPLYEVGEVDGLLFISMRFVQGVELGQLARDAGRLEPGRVAHLISQVADALDAAHAHGLVHRDVKPGNVLVDEQDHAYLTDFGLTKRMGDAAGMTRTGTFVGTLDYIAPEQVEGQAVDARADVYALGCVTYELLAGTVPFPRDSEMAKLLAHATEPAPRLVGVAAPLADAVERAMAKDPAERFPSAGDFGRAVQAGVEGREHDGAETVVARGGAAWHGHTRPVSAGGAPSGNRPGARRVWLLGLGGGALAAVLAVVLVVVLGSGSGSPSSPGAQTAPRAAPASPARTAASSQRAYYGPSCDQPGLAGAGYSMCERTGAGAGCPPSWKPRAEPDGAYICLNPRP